MKQIAIKMQLKPNNAEEYKNRHDQIWPKLSALLTDSGISDYSIFLDSDNETLFGVFKSNNEEALQKLPDHTIMKEWWGYMADIMHCNPNNSPTTEELRRVFYLP
jgi:L-rhamnose mutarotase